MLGLLYREDIDDVKHRLTDWWRTADIGRPAMMLTAPRAEPLERVEKMERVGWIDRDADRYLAYRLNLAARTCVNTHYLGEALPVISPDIGPNGLAQFLGCVATDHLSVWCHPCVYDPGLFRFALNRDSPAWLFCDRLMRALQEQGQGKYLVEIPMLDMGLDCLAAMRGSETLLTDLVDRPEWVQDGLRRITGFYMEAYDYFYDRLKDKNGGFNCWLCWAPERITHLQCDFSAMISPDMYREFMLPVLRDISFHTDFSWYHWDGEGALRHQDLFLTVPGISAVQWEPGLIEGQPNSAKSCWWRLHHKTLDAGKRVFVTGPTTVVDLKALKKEFGERFKRFIIRMDAESPEQAQEMLRLVEE